MEIIYAVRYEGQFAMITPSGAERDNYVCSQLFLNPSHLEGMRQHLQINGKIIRHRLTCEAQSEQQETTRAKEIDPSAKKIQTSIITREVLVYPSLTLGFETFEDAQLAFNKHICLCRNEDLVYPVDLQVMAVETFNDIKGWEAIECNKDDDGAECVGENRFKPYELNGETRYEEMYCKIDVIF